jgi:hypothetical protein
MILSTSDLRIGATRLSRTTPEETGTKELRSNSIVTLFEIPILFLKEHQK